MNLNPKCPQKKSLFSSLFKYSTDFLYITILEIKGIGDEFLLSE